MVRSLSGPRPRRPRRPKQPTRPDLEPCPGRGPCADRRSGPRGAGPVTPRTRGQVHGYGGIFCLGSLRLSTDQGPRSDHQPGFRGDQSRRPVQAQDHGTQPALADRLHLSEGHRLGLVLPCPRSSTTSHAISLPGNSARP